MIFVGIDDTDTHDTRGTNQLAKQMVCELAPDYECVWVVRHQLLDDPRIPYTSKNGSASIVLKSTSGADLPALFSRCEAIMRREFIEGSDPGLCVTDRVIPEITEFALRCQREIVTRADAIALAAKHNVPLKGLGGTCGGMIGALAAVGLAMAGNDGRVVQRGGDTEELIGVQPLEEITRRGVKVRAHADHAPVTSGVIDLGKKLRPNLRDGEFVLFVEHDPSDTGAEWRALKLV